MSHELKFEVYPASIFHFWWFSERLLFRAMTNKSGFGKWAPFGQKIHSLVRANVASSVLTRRRVLPVRMPNEATSLPPNFISVESRIHFLESAKIVGIKFRKMDSILPFPVSFERTLLRVDPLERTTASFVGNETPLAQQVSFGWSTDLFENHQQ